MGELDLVVWLVASVCNFLFDTFKLLKMSWRLIATWYDFCSINSNEIFFTPDELNHANPFAFSENDSYALDLDKLTETASDHFDA